MWTYVARRLLYAIPILFGVLVLTFIIFFAVTTPEDLVRQQLGKSPSEEQILAGMREQGFAELAPSGFEKIAQLEKVARGELVVSADERKALMLTPEDTAKFGWPRLAMNYIVSCLTFDFGETNDKRDVLEVVAEGMGPSLKLMIPAFIISEFFGVFFALFAALYRNTRTDRLLVLFSVLIMSISPVAMIIFAQKFFAYDWKYFPVSGYTDGFGGFIFLILPMLLYVMITLGSHVRFNRILMLDEINQDYVRTAKAKGVGQNVVLFKHVFRNALIPLITRWAVAIPMLYLGSLLLETFFAIPGLGGITVKAATNRDVNTIKALVYIGTIIYILATILSDVLYAVVDPRVKLK